MLKYQVSNGDVQLQVFASSCESDVAFLFLHGEEGNGAWDMIMQKAIQKLLKEYCCVFFDQRGCGLSLYNLEKGISFEDVMMDIYSVITKMKKVHKFKKLILVGDSFGGYFSLLFIEQYPELLDGMILMNPLLLLDENEKQLLYDFIRKTYLLHDHDMAKMLLILKDETPEHFFANKHVRSKIFHSKHPNIALCNIAAMADWIFYKPCLEALRKTTIPTLIMKGKHDLVTSEERIINVLLHLKNPFITYESFPESGHAIYVDQPTAFIERIHQFIREEFANDVA